jgi:hypothetical protein
MRNERFCTAWLHHLDQWEMTVLWLVVQLRKKLGLRIAYQSWLGSKEGSREAFGRETQFVLTGEGKSSLDQEDI